MPRWRGGWKRPPSGQPYLILLYTSSEDSSEDSLLLGLSLFTSLTFISAYSGPGHGTPTLHLNLLCSNVGPSVSSSLYPFVRDKFQLQNTGRTNPQQQLHWHPSKYLQKLARKSCWVHVLLSKALASMTITARLRHTSRDGKLGLPPRNLFLSCLCCIT